MSMSTTKKVLVSIGAVAAVSAIGGLVYWGVKEYCSETLADKIKDVTDTVVETAQDATA